MSGTLKINKHLDPNTGKELVFIETHEGLVYFQCENGIQVNQGQTPSNLLASSIVLILLGSSIILLNHYIQQRRNVLASVISSANRALKRV